MRTADSGRYAYFDVQGPELELASSGWGQRPTLLALPSGPGFSHKTLRPWLSPLQESARLVYVDLPGTGMASLNAGEDYGFQAFIADLEKLRGILGAQPVALLGHGWAATLAVEYALAHPSAVSALVLVNPIRIFNATGQDAEAQARQVAKLDSTLYPRFTDSVLGRFQAALKGEAPWEPVESDPWWSAMVLTQFAAPPPPAWKRGLCGEPWRMRAYATYKGAAMFDPDHPMARYDLADRLAVAREDLPVLIVGSSHDANYVASAALHADVLKAARPTASVVRMDDAGHFPFVEKTDAFAAHVAAFLAKAPSTVI